ncbi:MAG: penicillin acylase family protein, partial [Steroidobacteraceae bacterium]
MRWLARTAAVVLIAVVVSLAGAYALLRGSLPRLDGTIEARATDGGRALSAPVTIERDTLGIPTIRGASRADVAYATGFVHAQDRFFQMDLSRRLAAGELAELFGEAAEQDASARAFGFREVS